jgi:hypothetical protein
MVADADTEEVLGVSMVGHTAGEVIHDFLHLRSPRPPTLVQLMKELSLPLKVKSI